MNSSVKTQTWIVPLLTLKQLKNPLLQRFNNKALEINLYYFCGSKRFEIIDFRINSYFILYKRLVLQCSLQNKTKSMSCKFFSGLKTDTMKQSKSQ